MNGKSDTKPLNIFLSFCAPLQQALVLVGNFEPSLPVLLFCILFGLSMDYEVLMLSRMREEFLRTGDNAAACVPHGEHGHTYADPSPFGIIAAITPCTNPTETILCNSIGMLAAGNGVVFNVHPSAARVSAWLVHLINEAITAVGMDDSITHAVPLKMAADGTGFRLYAGKKWVGLSE